MTGKDLERLKLVRTLGPVAESVFALHLFGRHRGGSAQWRDQVRKRLGTDLVEVYQVCRAYRAVPDLLWLLETPRDGEPRPTGPAPREARHLAAITLAFCRAAVLPYWPRIQAALEIERDARGRMAMTNGIEQLLAALHPKVTWESSILEINSDQDMEIDLGGQGMILSPAWFMTSRQCILLPAEKQSGKPTLIYPVSTDATERDILAVDTESTGDQALSALVGTTRAAALRALTDGGTTGELSDRLGISLSGASKQATVLREAGLITTLRNRTTAVHTLTPLGMALLQRHIPSEKRPAAGLSDLAEPPRAVLGHRDPAT